MANKITKWGWGFLLIVAIVLLAHDAMKPVRIIEVPVIIEKEIIIEKEVNCLDQYTKQYQEITQIETLIQSRNLHTSKESAPRAIGGES